MTKDNGNGNGKAKTLTELAEQREREIRELRAENEQINADITTTEKEHYEALQNQHKIKASNQQYKNFGKAEFNEEEQRAYDEQQAKIDNAEKQLSEHHERKAELGRRIREANKQANELPAVDADTILATQEKLNTTKEKIAEVDAFIHSEHVRLEGLNTENTAELVRKREDLLAELKLSGNGGTKLQSSIDALDERILEAELHSDDLNQQREEIQATIAGLERKRDDLIEAAENLHNELNLQLQAYGQGEFNRSSQAYLRAAGNLENHFRRLIGLNNLVEQITGRPANLVRPGARMVIPTFHGKVFEGKAPGGRPAELFDSKFLRYMEETERVKTEWLQAGIEV